MRIVSSPCRFVHALIPYHAEPYRSPEEIYRGEPKSGTSHFHAYATAYVVRQGRRFSLVLPGE